MENFQHKNKMKKPDYTAMMNEKELVILTEEMKLEPGTLIGFRGFSGKDEKASVAYPLWGRKGEDEVQFVLGVSEAGRPIIDNDWIRGENIFINKEPIVVEIPVHNPQTFQDRFTSFFK